MKALLAILGSALGSIAVVGAVPVLVVSGGATVAGLGTLGLLAFRAYRRMRRPAW